MIRILPLVFFLFANVARAADDYSTSTALPVLPPVQPGPPYLEAGPMLGHISANDARVWVKATGQTSFSVGVSEDAAFANPRIVQGPELRSEGGFAGHVVLSDLKPATRYFYSVHLGAESQSTRPLPSFVTAPANGTRGITRFGFGSCVGKDGALDAATWADLEARTPIDFFLLLGDNHYANSADPVKQRAAFVAHRRNPGFLAFTRRTPLYGIWDDHDYGPNDSDGTLPEKEGALATFKQFFANPAYGEADNPGVYFALQRGDIDIFLLDGRYHRTPNKTVDDGTKTMLGAKQLAWLKRELLASKATIKFIASGSEWQTYSSADCWPSFARERREILDHLNQHAIRNVVFLSGDRHMTAAYQIEGRHLEVSSGPLGSPNSKVTKPSPETILYRDSGKLYCVFDVNTAHEPPQLTLEIYRAGDGLVEKRLFAWDEVTGAAKITPLGRARP